MSLPVWVRITRLPSIRAFGVFSAKYARPTKAPLLTASTSPVTQSPASAVKNSAACPMSAGVPNRLHGMLFRIASLKGGHQSGARLGVSLLLDGLTQHCVLRVHSCNLTRDNAPLSRVMT